MEQNFNTRKNFNSKTETTADIVGRICADAQAKVYRAFPSQATPAPDVSRRRETPWQQDARQQDQQPDLPLEFVNMSSWDAFPAPNRVWAVENRIPMRQPTYFSGEGAIGKTLVDLQRCVAHVLGKDWLGSNPRQGKVIYLSAEDEVEEIRRRLENILKYYGARFSDLGGCFHLLAYAGRDCVLGSADRSGIMRPTPLFNRVLEAAKEIQPVNISLDTCADIFAGNENDRTQVRQFVGLIRSLAIEGDCAVTILAHPSLTGIKSGSGLSGSTAWHNSVRSRMYMRTEAVEHDDISDPDVRVIKFVKNNYGPKDNTLRVRWVDGIYTVSGVNDAAESPKKIHANNGDDDLFMKLLVRLVDQGRNVSHSRTASNGAPAVMAGEPECIGKVNKRRLSFAMQRLFAAKKVKIEQYGRPSRPNQRLVPHERAARAASEMPGNEEHE